MLSKELGSNFFGVFLNALSKKEIISAIDKALTANGKSLEIATINPEILLKAEKDNDYRKILNNFNLKIVDGFGIKLAGFIKKMKTGERIAGADLAEIILNKAGDKKIGFIMKQGGLSSKEDLRSKIENLGINNFKVIYENDSFELIRDAEILLVGLGAPDQEQFIQVNKNHFSKLKLAVGVGGTFDFWTGRRKRAPLVLRKIGLEWLWRLILQPSRFFRIWNATAMFAWKIIKN